MKNKAFVVITLLYILFLGHFLFSNFVATIGPSYLPAPTEQNSLEDKCNPHGEDISSCLVPSCPLMTTADSDIPKVKGFPIQINELEVGCGTASIKSTYFNESVGVNIIYMVILTGLYASYVYRTVHKKQSKQVIKPTTSGR